MGGGRGEAGDLRPAGAGRSSPYSALPCLQPRRGEGEGGGGTEPEPRWPGPGEAGLPGRGPAPGERGPQAAGPAQAAGPGGRPRGARGCT